MLGGAWVPSFVFPEWLQTLSLFVPTRWAIDGLGGDDLARAGFSRRRWRRWGVAGDQRGVVRDCDLRFKWEE